MSMELLQAPAGPGPAFWFWVVCALLALAAELATLTFALLILSIGAALAALCAYVLPDSMTWQILTFSAGAVAAVLVGKRRSQQRQVASLDIVDTIGQRVTIESVDADGRVQSVRWRDSSWPAQNDKQDGAEDARYAPGDSACIAAMVGGTLHIRRA